MAWINTSVRFNKRGCILTLGRDMMSEVEERLAREMLNKDHPGMLEGWLKQVIADARPDLAHCQLRAMNWDFGTCEWWVIVHDDSLPIVGEGSEYPRVPLVAEALV